MEEKDKKRHLEDATLDANIFFWHDKRSFLCRAQVCTDLKYLHVTAYVSHHTLQLR